MRRIAREWRSSSQSQRTTFTEIFETNAWAGTESVSGPGSSQERAADFEGELVALLERWNIHSIVDAPCGDFNWMPNVLRHRDLRYTGIDIVEDLIARNAAVHAAPNRRFVCTDMTRGDIPEADVVICRDGLVHLSFVDAKAAIQNFRRSGSKYLLTTTFIGRSRNTNVPTGGWRVLNMQCAPFYFPAPLTLVDEHCTHSAGAYRDKRLGLWEFASLVA